MNSACSTPSPQEAFIAGSHAQPVRLFRSRYRHRLQRSRSPSRPPQANASTNDSSRLSIRSNIPWSEEGMSCWSDAATASTVLSLLHKEPLMPPPPTRSSSSESIQTTSKRNRLTCTVCFGHLDDGCFPDSPIAAACDHSGIPESHICVACLRRSLGVQVTSSSRCAVTCPLCRAQLSDEEVHHWASPQTFRAYDRMRTWQVLEEDAEFVTCIRPDCGYGQLHADGLEDPIVVDFVDKTGAGTVGYDGEEVIWMMIAPCYALDNPEMATWFLNHGADPNKRCQMRDATVPSYAIFEASFETIELFFAYRESTEHGQLLHYASMRRDSDGATILQYLYNKNPRIMERVNNVLDEGYPKFATNYRFRLCTPPQYAARAGSLDSVKFLVEHGGDRWRLDLYGRTALSYAVHNRTT
ncbi:hypothetical protein ATEIFO6365_0014021600 [Aspergillus terreus]|uniref:Uncharacterized protein n=1 Tax=Aspergillus terreus TaxID=33178 RepID=A0A5M3Z4L4_ASPTE|nr:hypothetical protein ATETN484_0008045600 [Aspergillus terreus]GFF21284.1 hypothetical protein ATEIFO6365_0014021600 [Aspergillus terreus]